MKSFQQTQDYITEKQIGLYISIGAFVSGIFATVFHFIRKEKSEINLTLSKFSDRAEEQEKKLVAIEVEQKGMKELFNLKIDHLTGKIEHYEKTNVKNQVMLMDAIDDFKNILEKK